MEDRQSCAMWKYVEGKEQFTTSRNTCISSPSSLTNVAFTRRPNIITNLQSTLNETEF